MEFGGGAISGCALPGDSLGCACSFVSSSFRVDRDILTPVLCWCQSDWWVLAQLESGIWPQQLSAKKPQTEIAASVRSQLAPRRFASSALGCSESAGSGHDPCPSLPFTEKGGADFEGLECFPPRGCIELGAGSLQG